MNEVIPRTKRGVEWKEFAERVLIHVDTYTVPQYGDKGEDNVTKWNSVDCIFTLGKYIARFGRNSRKGQAKLDMLKIAHYACLIYNKLSDKICEFYPKESDDSVCACGSDISGNFICTKEYSLSCQWAIERRLQGGRK